jgi:hypothetical protein
MESAGTPPPVRGNRADGDRAVNFSGPDRTSSLQVSPAAVQRMPQLLPARDMHGLGLAARLAGAVLILQGCGGGDAAPPSAPSVPVSPPPTSPPVVATLLPSYGSLLLLVGGETTLAVTARTAAGADLASPTVAWSSSDVAVASVTGAGVVRAVNTGSTQLRAVSGTAQATVTVTVVAQSTTLTGRVGVVGSGTMMGLQASVRPGGATGGPLYTADVSATGEFTVRAPLGSAATDSATFIVDRASGVRLYRPFYERYAVSALSTAIQRPLLVPRTVTVPSGSYAGQVVPVSLNEAFQLACDQPLDGNCHGLFPNPTVRAVALWPETKLPVRLAFVTTVSPTDSIEVWAGVRQLETDLGRALFRPASPSELTRIGASLFYQDAVVLDISQSLNANGGVGYWRADGTQSIDAGRAEFGTVAGMRGRQLLGHELGHTIGLGHTCATTSIMGRGFCLTGQWLARASNTDAAALELAYQIRRAVATFNPTTTLAGSLRGERVLELGITNSR